VLNRLRRVLRKPPSYIVERLSHELRMRSERVRGPRRARRWSALYLARLHGFATVDAWWQALGERPYLGHVGPAGAEYDALCPGDRARVLAAARRATEHIVDLLGSGDVHLGDRIEWHRDYKSGFVWPRSYFATLRYGDPAGGSDVKFPWELSRLQWMLPLGQAFLFTGKDEFALKARALIESWIEANPHASSINWACTMEVALRIVSLSWLFHAFKHAAAWRDTRFRGEFLRMLYLHADFTARHLEKSDINGNHYTADAAGLVYAGLFFGERADGKSWLESGWTILRNELPLQVYADGVDFEASIPYHRLVQELFLYPALYARLHGVETPRPYRERLVLMARYTAAYVRPDGSVPLVGDADDARTLPLGTQPINDHRYLLGISGMAFEDSELIAQFDGSRSEIYWLLGARAATTLNDRVRRHSVASASFPFGGCHVLRNAADHVFAVCAPLGLAGRGGHSHNDCLSVDAVLAGVHLFSDCGAYVYTADYAERNRFRSTTYHNTPRVDGEEINRLVSPTLLWWLHNDARPVVRDVSFASREDRLVLSHTGYERLAAPVTPVRTLTLYHATHTLRIEDAFEGTGEHLIEVPLHLALGVNVVQTSAGRILLAARGQTFAVTWSAVSDWQFEITEGRISPSYGVALPTQVLRWRRVGPLVGLTMNVSLE
jgi:hypothetical protein